MLPFSVHCSGGVNRDSIRGICLMGLRRRRTRALLFSPQTNDGIDTPRATSSMNEKRNPTLNFLWITISIELFNPERETLRVLCACSLCSAARTHARTYETRTRNDDSLSVNHLSDLNNIEDNFTKRTSDRNLFVHVPTFLLLRWFP